jgi:hypothetical protein
VKCLRPDRLADFTRGRLSREDRALVEQHLLTCVDCRRAAGRVTGAQEILREIVGAPVPEAGSVRTEATLRWLRVSPRPRVRPAFMAAFGLAACAAGLMLLIEQAPAPQAPRVAAVAPPTPAPVDTPLEAIVTLLGGQVDLDHAGARARLAAGTLLHGGDRLATHAGSRVAAQWNEGSGFLLLADAQLAMNELVTRSQKFELARGKVDVRVGPHQPGETLQVRTPAHSVTVHGTWFTVAADGAVTTVEVLEGSVEVSDLDGSSSTMLHAPARAVFGRGRASLSTLETREAARLRGQSELNLAAWTGLGRVRDGSGMLSVASEPDGQLAVDGVEYGPTPLAVRRPLGRHYIELTRKGFAPLKKWITVGHEEGELRASLLRTEASVPPPDAPVAIEEMVHDRARQIRACYERSLKRDPTLTGTVNLRLHVGPRGSVTQARVEDSTLPDPLVGECLQHEAGTWKFSAGRNATIVYPFVFRPE